MLVIVDYGMGNLRSLHYKLGKAGIEGLVSSSPDDVLRATKLILPGVGAFGKGMSNLHEYGLIPALNRKVIEERIPVMAICVGMQLLSKWGEEGDCAGLGWIDAETRRFKFDPPLGPLPVPHVGWNTLAVRKQSPLMATYDDTQRFYFTHSYHVCCNDPGDVVATTEYGYPFACVLQRGNIYATQFHPEKSHRRGFAMVKNFVELVDS